MRRFDFIASNIGRTSFFVDKEYFCWYQKLFELVLLFCASTMLHLRTGCEQTSPRRNIIFCAVIQFLEPVKKLCITTIFSLRTAFEQTTRRLNRNFGDVRQSLNLLNNCQPLPFYVLQQYRNNILRRKTEFLAM